MPPNIDLAQKHKFKIRLSSFQVMPAATRAELKPSKKGIRQESAVAVNFHWIG